MRRALRRSCVALAVCVLAVTLAGCNQTLTANRGSGARSILVAAQGKLPVLTPAQAKGLMSIP
jgi:hypothetical protein